MNRLKVSLATCSLLLLPSLSLGQSRPLVTEDPETVPTGHVLLEAGFDYQHGAVYPASGLTGNLIRVGTFGLSFGVSSLAEIQIDGGLRNRLSIATMDPDAPLADMLDRFTTGSILQLLAEVLRDRAGDQNAPSLRDAVGALYVLGVGLDALSPGPGR